jgi:hypothetical protein
MSAPRLPFVRVALFALAMAGGIWPGTAAAQQFRMESVVRLAGKEEVLSENLTLFDERLVYDFSFTPDGTRTLLEIVVHDVARQKFVLLDVPRAMRLELEHFQLVQMLEQLRVQANEDAGMEWLVHPAMQEEFDLDAGTLVLASDKIRYTAQCERPSDPAMLGALYGFMDQFTLLSASDPRRLPPFARMQFNQALRKYGFVPKAIELTVSGGGLLRPDLHVVTEHTLINQLSSTDRERIDQAREYWISFSKVKLAEYRQLEQVAGETSSEIGR